MNSARVPHPLRSLRSVGKDEYAGKGTGSSGTRGRIQPESPEKPTISTSSLQVFHLWMEAVSTFWLTTVVALVYFHSAIKM
jgi:hypothetical protein